MLPLTEDVDVLLAAIGCSRHERRKRSTYGRAFQPCVTCLKAGGWGKAGAVERIFPEAGWVNERRVLVRWFMKTRVPWLAFVQAHQDDLFFVPTWAQHLRIATDLLAHARLTVGSAKKTEVMMRVHAPALMNAALDDLAFRGALQGLVSLLPNDGAFGSSAALIEWVKFSSPADRREGAYRISQWLNVSSPPGVLVDPDAPGASEEAEDREFEDADEGNAGW